MSGDSKFVDLKSGTVTFELQPFEIEKIRKEREKEAFMHEYMLKMEEKNKQRLECIVFNRNTTEDDPNKDIHLINPLDGKVMIIREGLPVSLPLAVVAALRDSSYTDFRMVKDDNGNSKMEPYERQAYIIQILEGSQHKALTKEQRFARASKKNSAPLKRQANRDVLPPDADVEMAVPKMIDEREME